MSRESREALESWLERLDAGDGDSLLRCALLVACEEYPTLNMDPCVEQIASIARQVQGLLATDATATDRVRAINHVLFEQLGFHGNIEDYYDARNNFINEVLERQTGVPMSMSLLYIEVGRRVGLSLLGIGLPGHVIVRLMGEDAELFIDPFNGGVLLTRAGAEALAASFLTDGQEFSETWLEPLGPRPFLGRMLRNLKSVYAQTSDMSRLVWVCDLLVMVLPLDVVERRDRGLVLFSLRRYGLAAADLEYYLQQLPDEKERETLEELYRKARQLQAWMN